MIGFLLIVQVPDTSDKRLMSVTLSPIDGCTLCLKGAEDMIRVVFDHIIVDTAPLGAAFRSRFNVNICHASSPYFAGLILFASRATAFSLTLPVTSLM
jgi:hypothetical protein